MYCIFSQVPIFDRIISYLNVQDMLRFRRICMRVYQMFLIPSNKAILDRSIDLFNSRRSISCGGISCGCASIGITGPMGMAYYDDPMLIGIPIKKLKNHVKEQMKYNRILQNQMHKKYRKK